jgi:prepilin-type N-terminal cleavage/methylation domain-containing protein
MREPNMNATTRNRDDAEAGFTLVETLVAIVILVFGLMAVTNLLLVAASSNTVANQGSAAVTSATQAMEMLKITSFGTLGDGGVAITDDIDASTKACDDPTLVPGDFHCTDSVPGVGMIHTHWQVTTSAADPRLKHIRVQSEGLGALAGARSRADFTSFRACTNSDPATGGCPDPLEPPPPPPPTP